MRTFIVSMAVGVGLSVQPAFAAEPPPTSMDQEMCDVGELHRHHQHGGITQFVELSLDTLGEDETRQAPVDKAEDDLHECTEPVEAREKDVLLTVADGVGAGKVDREKVKAGIEQLKASGGTIHDCVAPVLNRLHGILLPTERAELGDKVRAHWAIWRRVNVEAAAAERSPHSQLTDLSTELTLTPAQVETMSAALQKTFAEKSAFDAEKVQKQVNAFASAFAAESFDATSVTTSSTMELSVHGLKRMALFYETVAPELTPAQRTMLSAHLKEHAEHHPVVAVEGGVR